MIVMNALKPSVQDTVEDLAHTLNFPSLYCSYTWNDDRWGSGFLDILELERTVSQAVLNGILGQKQLHQIARWGKLRQTISCPEPIHVAPLTVKNHLAWAIKEPEKAIQLLNQQIRGFAATYCSKLLRFAIPYAFGAIDTRLVRVFGLSDLTVSKYHILNITVTNIDGRWVIPTMQGTWPSEYRTWILILRELSDMLNDNGVRCPHPKIFPQAGLRVDGNWLPADVEMALFAFASQRINTSNRGCYYGE